MSIESLLTLTIENVVCQQRWYGGTIFIDCSQYWQHKIEHSVYSCYSEYAARIHENYLTLTLPANDSATEIPTSYQFHIV